MSQHRHDTDIQELKTYFTSVIDWISGVFSDVESEMRGIEWGRSGEDYLKLIITNHMIRWKQEAAHKEAPKVREDKAR